MAVEAYGASHLRSTATNEPHCLGSPPLPTATWHASRAFSEAGVAHFRGYWFRVLTSLVASNPLVCHRVTNALATSGLEPRGYIARMVMTMRGGDRPKNAHEEFADVTVMPRSMWEPWVLARKPIEGRVQDNLRRWGTGGLRRQSKDKPFGDVIQSHPTRAKERAIAPHPSLKPQSFLRKVVCASLPLREGVILDPFAGSGSTLAAAEAVGYASMGVEIDPFYVKVARTAILELAAIET